MKPRTAPELRRLGCSTSIAIRGQTTVSPYPGLPAKIAIPRASSPLLLAPGPGLCGEERQGTAETQSP